MPALRLTVFGSGSVGLAVAANFALVGVDVTVLARGEVIELLRRAGIKVTGACGDHTVAPGMLTISDANDPSAASLDCDVLITATKAYQVGEVLTHLAAKMQGAVAPRAVLLLQNGWGSADEARAILPATVDVFSSIMMIGIERRTPTHVHINVQASPVRIGTLFSCPSERMKAVVDRSVGGFLPVTYEDNVEPAILNKFLFNTCLNAVGALTAMTYGEQVRNQHTRQLITQLADETIRVIALDRKLKLAEDGAQYVVQTLTPFVLPKAASHRSSMLQDVEAGRRTEIDYLNGAVARIGKLRGIATPFNEAITSLVRARETDTAPAWPDR